MYSSKVNGHAVAGEHLTGRQDYFTVTTPVDIANSAGNGVSALDKLVEIISLRGQPVIQGTVTGTGPYTLKFSTEHKGSWNVTGNATTDNSAADLKAEIIKHGVDYGFNANTTVTVSSSL